MDVRCEKCGTEYELDETRLKPGGVTVKCTSCGHMFKIRKRATTNLGVPAIPAAAAQSDRAGRPSNSPVLPPSQPRAHTDSGSPERNWIIKMANGEQRTCRELGTLQQWIVQGLVRRDSMISRSGKTWKQLGDIPELAQFFGVAEEATRTKRDSARITSPQQAQRAATGKPPEAAHVEKATLLGMPTIEAPRARPKTQPPPPPKALAAHAGPMAPLPNTPLAALGGGGTPANDTRPKTSTPPPVPKAAAAAPPYSPPPPQPKPATPPQTFARPAPSKPPQVPAGERSTGAWATENVRPLEDTTGKPDSFTGAARGVKEEQGFVGQVKAVPTHDAAFVGAPRPARLSGAPAATTRGFSGVAEVPSEVDDDRTGPVIARDSGGGLGKWIAIISLVLMAGAAAAIYFMVIKQPAKSGEPTNEPAVTAGDAGTGAIAATIDGGTTITPMPVDDPLAAARETLLGDSGPAITAALKELAALTEQDAPTQALRARLMTALAQEMLDEAAFRDAKAADKLKKDAKKTVADAMVLAQKAVKTKADEVMAQVAMADVLRLQGKPAKEVEAYLKRAKGDREALFVEAMLAERDGKAADAKRGMTELEDGSDVRPSIRLALLAYAANDAPAAQERAEDVIARQPDHVVARLLIGKLQDTVASIDPMPPEEDIDAGVKAGSSSGSGHGSGTSKGTGTGSGTSKGTSSGSGDKAPTGDYDALLAKADHLAEVDCEKAMPFYAQALELKPNGVAALTGRGYCYIDSKQFSSAHSSFRAALAVSRKYEPALWGIAEAYQQQGLKDKAIESYQNYLEVYPGSSKAEKQLEKLGAPVGGGGGSSEEPPPEDKPPVEEKPPEEPPAETPPG